MSYNILRRKLHENSTSSCLEAFSSYQSSHEVESSSTSAETLQQILYVLQSKNRVGLTLHNASLNLSCNGKIIEKLNKMGEKLPGECIRKSMATKAVMLK